jgi:hypothetical protein
MMMVAVTLVEEMIGRKALKHLFLNIHSWPFFS